FIQLYRQPNSTLFPYTTLFRSKEAGNRCFLLGEGLKSLHRKITIFNPSTNKQLADLSGINEVGSRLVFNVLKGASRGSIRNCLGDRKSTRLNSSHVSISYAVFC